MKYKQKNSMKKYFFLAGLPRSGNTLLSSILNQNPDIKVSANSFLDDYMYQTAMFFNSEKYKNFPDEKSLDNLLSNTFDSYYKDWNCKYIVDRGMWGTPINLFLLKKYLKNEVKIICTVRDIVEIVASFLHMSKERLRQELSNDINCGLRFNESFKSENEILCEIVSRPNGQLENSLFSLNNLLKEENKEFLHIIEYKDLVNNPEKIIQEIYDFLEIEYFSHKYHYVNQFEANGIKYDDSIWNSNLHTLNKKIKFSDYKVSDVLSSELIQKYSNMEFWRK